MDGKSLTHVDTEGRARMVDVSGKEATHRRARAEGVLRLQPATLEAVRDGSVPKGDVFAVARIAGIQGAKRTSDLVPLCHPLRIDAVEVDVEALPPDRVRVEAVVCAFDRTGVEMEALAAVSAAALAVYDMVKAVDRGAVIESIRLLEKEGGKSGSWRREGGP
ncbi:MAG: cyclic pyranopterin monophosphate synthase MoaC [Planctomycetota bacterium]|jgi:cyclic pyranopterin phosphate synthase